jgi:L-ascorbate metabolism protein UlaG (beta-lactamase superfamily)
MDLIWHGQSCFTLVSKDKTIVFDPFDSDTGLSLGKPTADILLISHDHHDHNNANAVKPAKDEIKIIKEAGEYEFGGVYIQAVPAWHDDNMGKKLGQTLMMTVRIEGMVVGHLGDLGQSQLSDNQLDELNGIDILLVPVGGKYTIDGVQASKIVSQIDPRIVVPMHYKIEGLKIDLDGSDSFLKEEGAKNIEPKDKLKIEKKNLPVEEREVVILAARP